MKYLAVLLLLAGFALAEEPNPDLQLALRGAAALKTNLRDPESLKILRVVITKRDVHGDSISDVCFEYNAKNGVGGYTGTDVASYTADPKKETLRLSDGFESALGLCRLDEKLVKKGKATSSDLTDALLNISSEQP
jgi:hypothetical protein